MNLSHDLFHPSLSALEFVIRAGAVYFFVLILLRIGGKRQMAQMSPTEFVAVLLVSNAVQNSMNGGDNSLTGGCILAVVLIALSTGISYLTYRNRHARHLFEGVPTLLVHKGEIIEANMKKERVTHGELIAMLRRQNVEHLSEITQAVLEADGQLTLSLITDKKVFKD